MNMFVKLTIIFAILLQYISGSPLETSKPQYDVQKFTSPRIVGGQDAPKGYAKHMVALVLVHFKMLVCGGSIVSERHVLTAAHCIDAYVHWGELYPYLKGVIGSNYWNSTDYIDFQDYKIHPGWSWATLKNDIGLLVTAKKIVFGQLVAPIALDFNFIEGGEKAFVTGWGQVGVNDWSPHRLQLLYLNIISPKQCVLGMKIASIFLGSAPPVDPALEICTFHSRDHGMCFGDSGSALVLAGSGRQAGVVSWGMPCALGAPDVFARVSAFEDFLRAVLGNHIDY